MQRWNQRHLPHPNHRPHHLRASDEARDAYMPRPRNGSKGSGESDPTDPRAVHFRAALDVVCRRWRADVIWSLRHGPLRFNRMLASLAPISHKVLTQQLRALERAGVVERRVARRGRQVEYRLTVLGAELPAILDRLGEWGAAHERGIRDPSRSTVEPPGPYPPDDPSGRSRYQLGEP